MTDLHARVSRTLASRLAHGSLVFIAGVAVAASAEAEPKAPPSATAMPAPPAAAPAPAAPAAAAEAPPAPAAAGAAAATTTPVSKDAPKSEGEDDDDKPEVAPPPAHASDTNPAVPPPSPLDAPGHPPHSQASAPMQRDTTHDDDGRMGTHQVHFTAGVGLRESFITHSGFDPFSTNNVLPQVSFQAGRVVYASGPFSLATLLAFDWGSTKATARGADTELDVSRLTAMLEGRYHFWRRFYAFGRIAPGALHSAATLKDPVASVDRESNQWAFASDFSLGAAVEFAGEDRGESLRPRGWLGLDGGYGYAQATKLVLASNDTSAPARLAPLDLGELAVRGGFFRVNGTITF
jgi:hypothetical protein